MNEIINERMKEETEESRTEMKILYHRDLGNYDRTYVWMQRSILGSIFEEKYVALVSLNGRTEEKMCSTFIEAKKFIKEKLKEMMKDGLSEDYD